MHSKYSSVKEAKKLVPEALVRELEGGKGKEWLEATKGRKEQQARHSMQSLR